MSNKATVSFSRIATAPFAPRAELREALSLTGCEVSINSLPPGAAVPFVHSHKENEEVYLVLEGSGYFWLDGAVHPLKAGDAVRVDPSVGRCMKAADAEGITYVCIQARQNATPSVTREDGVVLQKEIQWR